MLTSSTLSIVSAGAAPGHYDETTWNEGAPKHVEEKGKAANPWIVYAASKVRVSTLSNFTYKSKCSHPIQTLAEKAAWEFIETAKPSFDFVAVLPTLNLGPFVHDVPTKAKLTSTLGVFAATLGNPNADTSGKFAGNWVDSRDAALLHVNSLITPAAGGQRIIGAAGVYSWQDVCG